MRVFCTASDAPSGVDVGEIEQNEASDLAVLIATSTSPNLPWKT